MQKKLSKTQQIIGALAMIVTALLAFAFFHSGSNDASPHADVPTQANLEDAQYLSDKYGLAAAQHCSDSADNYLRTIAKYDFGWDETGTLDLKFDHTLAHVDNPGVLTVFSQKAKLQNGFGAYKHIVLYCDYDTQTQIASFRIQK